MPWDNLVKLSKSDLALLIEALDSHTYWQLADAASRRDGHVDLGACEAECPRDCDDREWHGEVHQCVELSNRLMEVRDGTDSDEATPE